MSCRLVKTTSLPPYCQSIHGFVIFYNASSSSSSVSQVTSGKSSSLCMAVQRELNKTIGWLLTDVT